MLNVQKRMHNWYDEKKKDANTANNEIFILTKTKNYVYSVIAV